MRKKSAALFLIVLQLIAAFGVFLMFDSVQMRATQSPCTVTVNGDRTTVAATVAAAHDGDVICLNAGGPYTYSSAVEITNGGTIAVEIRGAGSLPAHGSAGLTQIYVAQSAPFFGYLVPGSVNHPTIDNIRFTQDENSSLSPRSEDIDISGANGQSGPAWIIHHNDFLWTGTCEGHGIVNGTRKGLIYRNIFTTEVNVGCGYTNTDLVAYLNAITDDGSFWQSAHTRGDADTGGDKNAYLEDNIVTGFNVGSDDQSNSRTVWRFNNFRNSQLVDHGFDSDAGNRHKEIYNNHFECGDYLNHPNELRGYISYRGGTSMIFNNTFDAFNATYCGTNNGTITKPAIEMGQYTAYVCNGGASWPGSYPDNYPTPRQLGWGWTSGYQIVGATAGFGGAAGLNEQGVPGLNNVTNGVQQALEPWYIFNNSNSAYQETYVTTGYTGSCRAMSWSTATKTSSIHTVVSPPSASAGYAIPYANAGMELVAVFADRIGGTAPTIASSPSCTWSALTGGTNSGLRLSAWHCTVVTGGPITLTATHDSSTAARALTLVTLRGLTASPLDKNPATTNSTGTTFNGTASGTLSTSTQIVLGYYALNGPLGDSINEGAGWEKSYAYSLVQGMTAFNGTNTGSADAFVGVVYKAVDTNATIQPQLTDGTSRDGISGTVTFKVNGNTTVGTASPLDNQVTDYLQENREWYKEASPFTGAAGTGSGLRTSRPGTCTTGVAWWSTDQGSWNTTGESGVLDKCTSTNTWTNAWYVPYTYPNPLATEPGGGGTSTTGTIPLFAMIFMLAFIVYNVQAYRNLVSHESVPQKQEHSYVEARHRQHPTDFKHD